MCALSDYSEAKRELKRWLRRRGAPHATALGLGLRRTAGKRTSDFALQIYVCRKRPARTLSRSDRLPATLDGMPIDVCESVPARFAGGHVRPTTGEVKARLRARRGRARVRPLQAGVSCSNQFVNCGTLGYFCVSDSAGLPRDSVYLLSAAHVFESPRTSHILQAAPADGGTDRDVVADVVASTPLSSNAARTNRVDAAVARVRSGLEVDPTLRGVGRITGASDAAVGMTVRKLGRTTGLTTGQVVSIDYETRVSFQYRRRSRPYPFTNQIRIEPIDPSHPFALFGDSGSLVVSENAAFAIGLYFAGAYDGSYGLATPIQRAQDALGVRLLGTSKGGNGQIACRNSY